MSGVPSRIELNDEEMKTLIEILKYSLDYCPIEVSSSEVQITRDNAEDILEKLENSLKAIPSTAKSQ